MINFINNILHKIPQINKIITERNNYFYENLELKKYINNSNKTYVNLDWAKEMLIKKKGLEANINNTQTLILGSSHGESAINPKFLKKTYNLSIPSQDLYYSYLLYKKYNTNKIKNIVLFYSVFSQGFNLIKTSEKQRGLLYDLIFSIPYKIKNDDTNIEKEKYNNYLSNIKKYLIIDKDYHGYNQNSFFIKMNISTKKRAIKHHKENIRKISQLIYIKKIYKLSKLYNQNFIIIIPPAQKIYRNYIPNSDKLFKKLFILTNKLGIKVYNFYKNNNFTVNDFWDSDHLNNQGAIKLTKLIKNIL